MALKHNKTIYRIIIGSLILLAFFILGYIIGKLTISEPEATTPNAYKILQDGYKRLQKDK